MSDKKEGLVGRFPAIVGDLVLLTDDEEIKAVSGYVVGSNVRIVTLSHENPNLKTPRLFRYGGITGLGFGQGDREYALRGFENCEILRRAIPEESS